MTLEEHLLQDSTQLYVQNPYNPNDEILNNPELVRELAMIWNDHEHALRTLVKVINANVVKYMVEKAHPVETVPLRHEMQGAERILHHFISLHALHSRNEENRNEEKPKENPQIEEEKSIL